MISNGEYAVPRGLVFGYPCRGDGKGYLAIVPGLALDDFGQERFKITLKELEEERDAVKELLPS
jgi:malate dehydrogenase